MSSEEEEKNVIANLERTVSRDTDSNIYGEDYYKTPFTNTEYEKSLKDINIDRILYDVAVGPGGAEKPLVTRAQSLPQIYEGHNVITDVYTVQNVSLDSMRGLDAPIYYAEPGYLLSFRLAVNDPLMSLKAYVKGKGDSGYSLADFTLRKMAVLGMGMTLGEAEETIYTTEGETSRDISGTPSEVSPYLARYKDLPSGSATEYEDYVGTEDDKWIVAVYEPKVPPKFNSLYFDVYNANPSGPRMIHSLEIKRYIIEDTRPYVDSHDFSKSILALDPGDLAAPTQNIEEKAAQIAPPVQTAAYTKRRGKLQPVTDSLFMSNENNIISIDREQQNNALFSNVTDANSQMMNDLMRLKYQKINKLKSVK